MLGVCILIVTGCVPALGGWVAALMGQSTALFSTGHKAAAAAKPSAQYMLLLLAWGTLCVLPAGIAWMQVRFVLPVWYFARLMTFAWQVVLLQGWGHRPLALYDSIIGATVALYGMQQLEVRSAQCALEVHAHPRCLAPPALLRPPPSQSVQASGPPFTWRASLAVSPGGRLLCRRQQPLPASRGYDDAELRPVSSMVHHASSTHVCVHSCCESALASRCVFIPRTPLPQPFKEGTLCSPALPPP